MPSTTKKPFNHVESAAVEAAVRRARTGRSGRIGPDPALHRGDKGTELHSVRDVLRHRLSGRFLRRPIGIIAKDDDVHPLLMSGRHFPAVALSIPFADGSLDFLATYDDSSRLTFDLLAPCDRCQKPVPSEEINSLEDLGDFLLQARDTLGGSPRLRTSPAHTADCVALGD
ncbi:hypothetical protein OG749_47055 (plasmid) [Streptomyces nojiriensis]|uniref:hypothetical protein n=1 Tax=Streptomyces nojiriensis TaxID=66374 RepID=UPI002E1715AF